MPSTLGPMRTAWCAVVLTFAAGHSFGQTVVPTPAPVFLPMTTPMVPLNQQPAGADVPALASETVTLQPGAYRIFGQVAFTSTSGAHVLAVSWVECKGDDGTQSEQGQTNQNYQGEFTGIGDSYPEIGVYIAKPSLLFYAPTAQKYTCGIYASSTTPSLTVIAADDFLGPATWLQVSSASEDANWWQNAFCDMYGNTVPTAQNDYSQCLYLGGASGQQDVYEFDNDGSPNQLWTPADTDAAFISAQDSLLVTTCYYGTHSCTSDNSEGWWTSIWDDPGGTRVLSHLELIQLDNLGNFCKVSQSPDEITWVGNAPHHYMIYHSLNDVPVYPECGSRQFKLRMYVKYLSGNPVKIDGSHYGGGGTAFTHAYAWTSERGFMNPVPNLFGLTQTQAQDQIMNSEYNVATITCATSLEPVGTVTGQIPAAGIIELPRSGVGFTLSAGGASVAALVGESESIAITRIKSLGLVPYVTSSKACIEPGAVFKQSPSFGTVVALGSAVYISLDSGTYQTCLIK